jgi:hypothetical protein
METEKQVVLYAPIVVLCCLQSRGADGNYLWKTALQIKEETKLEYIVIQAIMLRYVKDGVVERMTMRNGTKRYRKTKK